MTDRVPLMMSSRVHVNVHNNFDVNIVKYFRTIGVVSAKVSRMEGMEGHARAADVRLEKYFPGEKFDIHPAKNFR